MPTRKHHMMLLCLLYVIQGLPYGFQTRFLPIFLRSHGVSLTSLGFFKLLLIPWLCKVLWAPFVDRYGSKKDWLIISVCALAATWLLNSFVQPTDVTALCCVVFLLNLFAATQDIAVDGIAIVTLSDSQLGHGNALIVVGYKVGSVIGGGLLAWLVVMLQWKSVFIFLACLYMAAAGLVCLSDTLKTAQKSQHIGHVNHTTSVKCNCVGECSCIEAKGSSVNTHRSVLSEARCSSQQPECVMSTNLCTYVYQLLHVPGTDWMLMHVLVYKLGEVGAIGMLPLFLVDQGINADSLIFYTAVIGQILSIGGSLIGGFLISHTRLCTKLVLKKCVHWRLFPALLKVVIILVWQNGPLQPLFYGIALFALGIMLVLSGIITTATFTLMMQCSKSAPPSVHATHFTVLSTCEVFGKLSFMSLTGWLTDVLGYPCMYVVLFVLIFVAIPCIHRLKTTPQQHSD